MPEFPANAITKKKGDKSVYDWVEITVEYVIPRIVTFQAAKVQPTIRGLYYFLTDSQVIAKGGKFYKSFDSAMVDARKKNPGDRGYIPPGTFSDNTRRIIDIDYLQENSWAKAKGKDKKINKSDVMRYMEDTSRVMTTHKIITDLIREGKIKLIKDKPHSQTHYLDINNDNKFNKINQELAGMEVDFKRIEIPKRNPTKEEWLILRIFSKLEEIERLPEKDSQILYSKLRKSMLPLMAKFLNARGEFRKQQKEEYRRQAAKK